MSIGYVSWYVMEGEFVCVCVSVFRFVCMCVYVLLLCVDNLCLCASVSVLLVLGVTSTEVLGPFNYSHAHIVARQCV